MKILILFLLLSSTLIEQSNKPVITRIQNDKVIEVVISIQPCERYTNENFSLSIYKKNNPYGSAQNESGEITQSFYFAISDADDVPKHSLFEIGEFYSPEIEEILKFENLIEVRMSYYEDLKKVYRTFKVLKNDVR